MSKRAGAALFLAMAALFLIANRAAYKGFFQDDELDNLSWTRDIPAVEYAKAILTPRFFTNNFRPVGHFYFREMSLLYGLDFPKYVPLLHLAHLINVSLVWLIARQLGFRPLASSLGTLLFGFHMAAFDIYWKPMYAFDLFCATFSLLAILLYTRRRFVLSFCAFWLAYKSKELAVMLPAVLACYEYWLAKDRNWKRLIPFFAVSLSFGLQGMLLNPNLDNEYTFRFTPAAFWTCLRFYASRIFLIPYAGLAVIALPFVVRDRRLWFGAAMMFLFFVPLLFLPGRLFPAYCYLPLAGLALMAAAAASLPNATPVVALLCVAWFPWNLAQLRKSRSYTLAEDDENRTYVAALIDFSRASKNTRAFVHDGAPAAMHPWGINGALRFLYGHPGPDLYSISDPQAAAAIQRPDSAMLKWNPAIHKLSVVTGAPTGPLLGAGWYSQEDGFRWIAPHATATLARPEGSREFELVVNISPDQINQTGPIEVAVSLDGIDIGKRRFTANGVQTSHWPAPQSIRRNAAVDFQVTPEYRPTNGDMRRLGVAVVGFGFR